MVYIALVAKGLFDNRHRCVLTYGQSVKANSLNNLQTQNAI